MGTHTPGPWQIDVHAEGEHMADMIRRSRDWIAIETVDEDGGHVAYCHHSNAFLLAAAPELLAALKNVLEQLDWIGIPDWHGAEGLSLESARSAILKAEGRGE